MTIPLELIAFVAIVLGIIARTYFPYLKKKSSDVYVTFDAGFIATAIFSGVVSAIFIYPVFVFPETTDVLKVFISAFIFAYAANDGVNRIAK